jgi:hypothetical protein
MADYPEHEKMLKIRNQSQAIGEFLEWLENEGIVLAEWEGDKLWPSRESISHFLASYFGINPLQLELEKRRMLETIRTQRYTGE